MKTLSLILLLGLVTGCAAKSAFKFSAKDVAKATINPKYCTVLPNGELDCNHVRVLLGTVPVESLK